MRSDLAVSHRTADPLPRGVAVATLVFVLSTASPESAPVPDEVDRVRVPAIEPTADPVIGTASARLQSDLQYLEMIGPRAWSKAAAGSLGASVDQREPLREQIRSLLMEADDHLGGTPPSKAAIHDALRFVDLLPADSPTPHVSVADDGEINFFRRRDGLYVDVGFFGDGQIHYYARLEDQGIDVDGSRPFSGRSLPRDLVIPITTE